VLVAFGSAHVPAEGSFSLSFETGLVLSGRMASGVAAGLRASFGSREVAVPQRAFLVSSPSLPSVAGGPGDPGLWDEHFGAPVQDSESEARARAHKEGALPPRLADLYREVRVMREASPGDRERLAEIASEARRYPDDWLLALEIEELAPGVGD
jgi:phenylalanine-4-hydroxylase